MRSSEAGAAKRYRWGIAKAVMLFLLMFCCGAAAVVTAWAGLVEGVIGIHSKNAPTYLVYRDGPTSDRFFFEVWERFVLGGLFAASGLLLLLLLLFGGPERRSKMLAAGERARLDQRERDRIPVWLAAAVITALIVFFVLLVLMRLA